MPRPACHATEPTACDHRRRALVEGTFRYDFRRAGWYWLDCRTPHLPWRTCPWCGNPLPEGGDVMRRIVDAIRQSDGYSETGEGAE